MRVSHPAVVSTVKYYTILAYLDSRGVGIHQYRSPLHDSAPARGGVGLNLKPSREAGKDNGKWQERLVGEIEYARSCQKQD